MKKYIYSFLLIMAGLPSVAQFDYHPTGRFDVPVTGMQLGFVGGGFTAMLPNRDDIDADQRLDPQMMNFSYGGGFEAIYWVQKTTGIGGQLLYWQGGAAYTGLDTLTKLKLKAKTTLSYAKLPILFHYKSYNRYYPDRRTRFNAYFGPYVALLYDYSDQVSYTKTDDPEFKAYYNFDRNMFITKGLTGKFSGELYNPFELGFVFGVGAEVRLWRRTVIALSLRTDIGISNVEDDRFGRMVYSDNTVDSNYNFWSGNYAKYNEPNILDIADGWQPNRPVTRNFSLGAFLSVRKYLSRY